MPSSSSNLRVYSNLLPGTVIYVVALLNKGWVNKKSRLASCCVSLFAWNYKLEVNRCEWHRRTGWATARSLGRNQTTQGILPSLVTSYILLEMIVRCVTHPLGGEKMTILGLRGVNMQIIDSVIRKLTEKEEGEEIGLQMAERGTEIEK